MSKTLTAKNRHISFLGLFLVGLLMPNLLLSQVKASGQFEAGNLISDANFTSKDSMSVAEIQSFLETRGSVLVRVSPSQLGEGNNGRSAAQIIYEAVRTARTDFASSIYGPSNPLQLSLNPQIVLVTLQKEQSLITGTYDPNSASTATALKWAMGMGCPDGIGCSEAYAGFTNQVVYGAAQLMYNYYRAASSLYKPGLTYTISNTTGAPYYAAATQSVTIANSATSSLYQYTPHVFNGNYNFWLYMNRWFNIPPYRPDLALDPSDGTVYVVDDNGRWPVTAQGFSAWNFAWSDVKPITAQQLAFPVKSRFTHLIVDEEGTVWYIENGYKRVINSGRIFDRWGFNWQDVSWVAAAIMSKVPYGLPGYELVMSTGGDGTVNLATNSTLYPISGDMFVNAWNYSYREIGQVPGSVLTGLSTGKTLGRLVMLVGGDGTVFLVDLGVGYKLTGAVASAWRFDLSQTCTVGPSVLNEKGSGGYLTNLVRQADGDGTVYLVQDGQKRPITRSGWLANGYNGSDVRAVSANLLNTLTAGATVR